MVGCAIIIAMIFSTLFKKCLRKMKLMHEEDEEIIVDEKLGTFFECLSIWDRKQWLAQEIHSNQRLGISTMGEWTKN